MWYVIQTVTGKEEDLITFIQTMLKKDLYTDCFIMKAEWMKRLSGEWKMQVRNLFPGYVFIDTSQPEQMFLELKNIPQFSKILGTGEFEFIAVKEKEKKFLELISENPDEADESVHCRFMRLTEIVVDEKGTIVRMNGALQYFKEEIEKINFHKRFAVVKTDLIRTDQTLIFGIKLEKDAG